MYYWKWHNGVGNCLARRPGSWMWSQALPFHISTSTETDRDTLGKRSKTTYTLLLSGVCDLKLQHFAPVKWLGSWRIPSQFSFSVQPRIRKWGSDLDSTTGLPTDQREAQHENQEQNGMLTLPLLLNRVLEAHSNVVRKRNTTYKYWKVTWPRFTDDGVIFLEGPRCSLQNLGTKESIKR